ncbi:MAG: hypothetical protein AAGM22_29875, partial [Acidobacteriota bacterium]
MSNLPRVNCHVHVFNLEVATTDWGLQVLRDRAREDFGSWAGDLLADAAEDVVRGLHSLNEETLLRFFLRKLGLDPDPPPALAEPVLRFLRRRVDRAIESFRRDRDDAAHADLHDILETLRIAGKASLRQVTEGLMHQLDGHDAVVPLMMDLTDGVADVAGLARTETKFHRQLVETSDMVLAYPGRVLPFVKVNPLRPDHLEIMRDALEHRGFLGVKLYPSLGYRLDSGEMDAVYDYCQRHSVPILVHTNRSGFVGEPGVSNFFPDPEVWRLHILPRFPHLKVCLAHFGGSSAMGAPVGADPTAFPETADGPSWGHRIAELLRDDRFPNIYADVAFHRIGMESEENFVNYFTRLKALLDAPSTGERILFGTDFWLIRPRLRESSHWRYFERGLETDVRFRRLSVDNPASFLGLPGGGGRNAAVGHYVRFILQQKNRLKATPAPWLLDAIERQAGAAERRAIEHRTSSFSTPRRLLGDRLETLLSVADLPLTRDFSRTVKADLEPLNATVLGGAVAFEASGELKVDVFHRVDQEDEDGVLRPTPAASAGRGADRPGAKTLLSLGGDRAYVKTRLRGRVAAAVDAAHGLASLAVDTDRNVVLTDYRAYPRDRGLLSVLPRHLLRPRLALDRDDVLRLGEGDAVSFQASGRLSGELSLQWYDVLVSGVDALSEALGGDLPLSLEVDLGAAIAVRVDVQDDFNVSFARHGDRIRVWVRKLASRGAALALEVRGGVQFQNPDELVSVLSQLIAQKLSVAEEQVLAVLHNLEEEGGDAFSALEKALGVDGQGAVRAAVDELAGRLESAIVRIARARVEVGFEYQYRRLETESVLLKAELSERVVEQLHHELVDGDFRGLLERVRAGAGDEIFLDEFLRFREQLRESAWGFRLGPVGYGRRRMRQFRDVSNLDGHRRLAFHGAENYSESWPAAVGGDFALRHWHWSVDFRAEMSSFDAAPRAAHFDYGLAFQVRFTGGFHKTEIADWLDHARVWRAVSPAISVDQIYTAFKPLQRKEVDVAIELVVPAPVLAELLHGPLAIDPTGARRRALDARALAAGMPYRDETARSSPTARRRFFGELWDDLLRRESGAAFPSARRDKARVWAHKAAAKLAGEGLGKAAGAERRGPNAPSNSQWIPWTFGGRLYLDGGPA